MNTTTTDSTANTQSHSSSKHPSRTHFLIYPMNTSILWSYTLSTHPIDAPYQYSLVEQPPSQHTLSKHLQGAIDKDQASVLGKKMQKGDFDFDDFLLQAQSVRKMGGMGGMLKMIPGKSRHHFQRILMINLNTPFLLYTLTLTLLSPYHVFISTQVWLAKSTMSSCSRPKNV